VAKDRHSPKHLRALHQRLELSIAPDTSDEGYSYETMSSLEQSEEQDVNVHQQSQKIIAATAAVAKIVPAEKPRQDLRLSELKCEKVDRKLCSTDLFGIPQIPANIPLIAKPDEAALTQSQITIAIPKAKPTLTKPVQEANPTKRQEAKAEEANPAQPKKPLEAKTILVTQAQEPVQIQVRNVQVYSSSTTSQIKQVQTPSKKL